MPSPSLLVLDSNALLKAAVNGADINHPLVQFIEGHSANLVTFVIAPIAMTKAYSLAATNTRRTIIYRNIDRVIAPYWSNNAQYEIVDLNSRSNVKKLGEFMAQHMKTYSFEECVVAYLCEEVYPGAQICGFESALYHDLGLTIAFQIT